MTILKIYEQNPCANQRGIFDVFLDIEASLKSNRDQKFLPISIPIFRPHSNQSISIAISDKIRAEFSMSFSMSRTPSNQKEIENSFIN